MTEQFNKDIKQIIRDSLAETKSWNWDDDDRKWAAAGAALKYLEANSTMSEEMACAMALKITEEIMKDDALTEDLAKIEEQTGDRGFINLSATSWATAEPIEREP